MQLSRVLIGLILANTLALPVWAVAPPVLGPPSTDRDGDPLPSLAVARLGTTRLRHAGDVTAVCFSPDGKLVASAGMDKVVRLWDAATGRLRLQITGHTNAVEGVAFAPGGKVLATGGMDATIRSWDIETGKQLRVMETGRHMVSVLTYSADGKWLASGGWDGHVRIWDAATGGQRFDLPGHSRTVRGLAFFPDSRRLMSAGQDRSILLRDAITGKDIDRIEVPGRVRDPGFDSPFAISPTGKEMAIAQGGSAVAIMDASGKELIRRLPAVGVVVYAVAWSPDGKTLATSANDGVIRLWNPATAESLRTCPQPAGRVGTLAFSPDGKTLASAQGCSVRLWDVATGTPRPGAEGHFDSVSCVAVDPTGALVATGSADTSVIVWDRAGTKVQHRLWGHAFGVNCLAFSPKARLLAVGGRDNLIRLYDPDSGKPLGTLQTKNLGTMSLAFTPDGKTLLSGGADGVLRLWDPETKTEKRSIGTPSPLGRYSNGVSSLAFSADGKSLAIAQGTGARLVDFPSNRHRHHFAGSFGISPAVLTADGKTLATVRGGAILLWEAATGRKLYQTQGDSRGLYSLAFSPSGGLLCSGGEDGRVRLWDPVTGKERRFLAGHTGAVRALAFGPDGNHLVSAGADSTALVWDVSGRPASLARAARQDMANLWEDLASHDAAHAYVTILRLGETPGPAVAALRGRLRRAELDLNHVRLVADLGDEKASVRTAARTRLDALGFLAEAPMRRALSQNPPPRVKEQLVERLEKLEEPIVPPQRLRLLRAIEALERIGTPEAKELLRELALGVREAEQTREAAAALARLRCEAR